MIPAVPEIPQPPTKMMAELLLIEQIADPYDQLMAGLRMNADAYLSRAVLGINWNTIPGRVFP